MSNNNEKRESAYRPLPQSITGPIVDIEFWQTQVGPAGMGLVEQGADRAVKQLRSMPPPIVILRL